MADDNADVRVHCSLVLEFASPEDAEKVHGSIELDNQGYVSTRTVGNSIHAEMSSSSLNSLLHTIDDLMACASVAERIVSRRG